MAKVSIIVPVYNAAPSIERCCASIIKQSFEDIEIILVDDGSTDESLSLCRKIADEDVRVFVFHQENKGVSAARNRGIEEATGEYLMFVDADDWIEPNAIETALQYISDKVDIVTYSYICEYGNRSVPCVLENAEISINDLFEQYQKKDDTIRCTIWNKLYKADIIKDNMIQFPLGIKFGEDFVFNARVYQFADSIVTIPDLLYHYDCSNENSCVNKLYPDVDRFINMMDTELMNLLNKQHIAAGIADSFRQSFIGSRWNYVTDVCVRSNISVEEKAVILNRWIEKIPPEAFSWTVITNGRFNKLIVQSNCDESSLQILEKKLNSFIERRQHGGVLICVKTAIKQIIGRVCGRKGR